MTESSTEMNVSAVLVAKLSLLRSFAFSTNRSITISLPLGESVDPPVS